MQDKDQIKSDKSESQQVSESENQQQTEEQTNGAEATQEAPVEAQSEATEPEKAEPEAQHEQPAEGVADEAAAPQNKARSTEAESKEESVSEDEAGMDDSAVETPSTTSDTSESSKTNDHPDAKWYVVHTYSGHENKVAATLKQRIESEKLEKKIFEVLVPMQDKIEIRGGKKTEVKEKIFPGYILVKMILDDNTWLAVRTTQGVTSFVGMGNKPTPIPESEVQTIVRFTQIQQPTFKQIFMADDTVKIVDGPFAEFIGKVDSVDEEKGKVKVLVSIFGRETPVELDFLQVQKI